MGNIFKNSIKYIPLVIKTYSYLDGYSQFEGPLFVMQLVYNLQLLTTAPEQFIIIMFGPLIHNTDANGKFLHAQLVLHNKLKTVKVLHTLIKFIAN